MDGCVWYEDSGRRGGTEPSGGQGRSEAARTVVLSLLRLLLLEASAVPSHLIHEKLFLAYMKGCMLFILQDSGQWIKSRCQVDFFPADLLIVKMHKGLIAQALDVGKIEVPSPKEESSSTDSEASRDTENFDTSGDDDNDRNHKHRRPLPCSCIL
ncbi:uncharacterized protein [Triticum aestivum]|uniref:uncharacterized protein n=1 Tax=Triticum aestivum TaxID=4565 RepID=UPI00098A7DD9|nr:uncharacterized protein LOC109748477 isoform X1 [Aegilops tauschii subsp. strangulata]XP_020163090.1 uncharacterized protein LOC109748477 isoform X1 [Aegilops tauschii subsp. strangulata]XP_044445311.1 uncharacterized protein LOC123172384 [Triticum aestivum]